MEWDMLKSVENGPQQMVESSENELIEGEVIIEEEFRDKRNAIDALQASKTSVGISEDSQQSSSPKHDSGLKKIARARMERVASVRALQEDKPTSSKKVVLSLLMIICTVFILASASIVLLAASGDEAYPPEPEIMYEIQQVMLGRLVSLSKDGAVAAVEDDFDMVQVYRMNESKTPLWKPMGSLLRPRGTVDLSANGTLIAFVDDSTRRPHVMEYDPTVDSWRKQDMPIIVCDDISMDLDASLLTVGVFQRGIQRGNPVNDTADVVITYKYDGTNWIEYANRLLISGMQSFEVSPTATTMVISTQVEDAMDTITSVHTYRLFDKVDGIVWERVNHDVALETDQAAFSLATDVFAVASPDSVEVFSYSGRTWGAELEPRENFTFTSVALSLDGRTLAVGSVAQNSSGIVDWYTFPYEYDTGDDWEVKGPPLRDEWQLDEPPLRDEYGKESPMFGHMIDVDGEAKTIAVQSGLEGNENVHFYDAILS